MNVDWLLYWKGTHMILVRMAVVAASVVGTLLRPADKLVYRICQRLAVWMGRSFLGKPASHATIKRKHTHKKQWLKCYCCCCCCRWEIFRIRIVVTTLGRIRRRMQRIKNQIQSKSNKFVVLENISIEIDYTYEILIVDRSHWFHVHLKVGNK